MSFGEGGSNFIQHPMKKSNKQKTNKNIPKQKSNKPIKIIKNKNKMEIVKEIIEAVRQKRDRAVGYYTKKFDNLTILSARKQF